METVEFGGGIVAGLRPRGLPAVECVDLSEASSKRLWGAIDALPNHPGVPRLLERLARRAELLQPGRGQQVHRRFAERHPRSIHAADASDRRAVVQEVRLDRDRPPDAIAMVFRSREGGYDHGCYWAARPEACGGFVRPSCRYMGTLPTPGRWHALRIGVETVGIHRAELLSVGWAAKDGAALWGPTRLVGAGREADLLPNGAALSGSGEGRWLDAGPDRQQPAHTAGKHAGWAFYYHAAGRALADLRGPARPAGRDDMNVEAYLAGIDALAGDPAVVDFLRAGERSAGRELAARLYRHAVRTNASAAFVYRLLVRLAVLASDGAVVRQVFTVSLDRAVAHGKPGTWQPRPLRLTLTRTGRRWLPGVPGIAPTFNLSSHAGTIADPLAPLRRLPVRMVIGSDPYVEGDPKAEYTLDLDVRDGFVIGSFSGRFRGGRAAGAVTGRCEAGYAVDADDLPAQAVAAMAEVRKLIREAGVTPRQQRLFEHELSRADDYRSFPAVVDP